jgi:hypothetical protein
MKLTTRICKEAEKKFDITKTDARHQYARLKAQELGFTSPSNMMRVL